MHIMYRIIGLYMHITENAVSICFITRYYVHVVVPVVYVSSSRNMLYSRNAVTLLLLFIIIGNSVVESESRVVFVDITAGITLHHYLVTVFNNGVKNINHACRFVTSRTAAGIISYYIILP